MLSSHTHTAWSGARPLLTCLPCQVCEWDYEDFLPTGMPEIKYVVKLEVLGSYKTKYEMEVL